MYDGGTRHLQSIGDSRELGSRGCAVIGEPGWGGALNGGGKGQYRRSTTKKRVIKKRLDATSLRC